MLRRARVYKALELKAELDPLHDCYESAKEVYSSTFTKNH